MRRGWSFDGHSILCRNVLLQWLVGLLAFSGSDAAPAPVMLRIGSSGGCTELSGSVELNLVANTQIFVPSSSLPVWNVVSAEPAMVVVHACRTLQQDACRAVRVRPIAERCSALAPLGIVVFGTKRTNPSVPANTILATAAIVAVVVFCGMQVHYGS
jgi:hypothetical protein